ncbi:hypothetical protein Bca52824_053400 [Brassica carinata]|uniref:Uncharacterized protein n=1 Tax=Brassica carinata TaxID=52824 RepID=A0A8X7UJK8_BRACI|nr:hypothetical protein Bca52824_053400 [Brassica carinata]
MIIWTFGIGTDEAKRKARRLLKAARLILWVKGATSIMQALGASLGEPPSYTALVGETHSTRWDFVDYRAEEMNAKSKRGYVYGLGSEQFREHAPSSRVPNGIARNLDLEMRVGGLETTLQSVTSDVAGVKQGVSDMRRDFAATREAINQLLQTLRPLEHLLDRLRSSGSSTNWSA